MTYSIRRFPLQRPMSCHSQFTTSDTGVFAKRAASNNFRRLRSGSPLLAAAAASHFRAQKPQKAGGRHGLVVTPRASLDWQGNRPPLRGGMRDTPTSPPRDVPTGITSRTDGVPSLLLDVAPHARADGHCSFWCLPVACTGATADHGREAAHAAASEALLTVAISQ